MVDPSITAAVTAAVVTVILGVIVSGLRYAFDTQLATRQEVDNKIEQANAVRQDDLDSIIERLDEHGEHLENIEQLIMGSKYQVEDGMLEIVERSAAGLEDHEERIDGVERIQLKIRRRQREQSGETVAESEDVNPPPDYSDDRITDDANDPDAD